MFDMLNNFAIEIGIGGVIVLFTAFVAGLLLIGLYFLLVLNKMHPKVWFKIYSRKGVWTVPMRLFNGEVPTHLSIIDILLGFSATGFPIKYFRREIYDGKWFYVAQNIEGRIFPLPLEEVLGNLTFIEKYCPNPSCESTKEGVGNYGDYEKKCRRCGSELKTRPVVMSALYLHALKFNPDIEQRMIYRMETDGGTGSLIPLYEYITVYDIGSRIVEMMNEARRETKTILDQKSPFITALIAALPMGILLLFFGIVIYLLWIQLGSSFTEGANAVKEATENLKMLYNITNSTG